MSNSELIDDAVFDSDKPLDEVIAPVIPKKHFNENSIYYKGLFGMIFCLIPAAIFGLILVKISLEQSKKAKTLFREYPENYLDSTIKKIKTGRIMAFIGLALFILEIVALMVYMSIN